MTFEAIRKHPCFTLLLAVLLIPNATLCAHADEGLYKPGHIPLPRPVRSAAESVVPIQDKIRFDVAVLPSKQDVKSYRKNHPFKKTFLPEGGTIWPVAIDTASLVQICSGAEAYQPGTGAICRSAKCSPAPCHYQTDWTSADATGFAVGRTPSGDLIVATVYHVARESIERDKRTGGVHDFHLAPAPDLTARLLTKGGNYGSPRSVELLANASSADWGKGDDWALLVVPGTAKSPIQPLPLAKVRPNTGDKIWVIGFPYRTRRQLRHSASYDNADGSLRISVGSVVPRPRNDQDKSPSDIFTTNDGVAGNSGSPAVNAQGEVIGIFRAHTFYENGVDKRISKFGGLAQIVDAAMFSNVLKSKPVNQPETPGAASASFTPVSSNLPTTSNAASVPATPAVLATPSSPSPAAMGQAL